MSAVNDIVRRSNGDGTYTVGFVSSVGTETTPVVVVRQLATIAADGTVSRIGDSAAAIPAAQPNTLWPKIA